MDAAKFIKERARMCDSLFGCEGCPANSQEDGLGECFVGIKSKYAPEQQIDIVEKRSAEHPRKTRQSEFLEQHPNASLDKNGILRILPCYIDKNFEHSTHGCSVFVSCTACTRDYWSKEVE